MPLVSADWQDPARWAPARVAWGVARDGDTLRLARIGRSGAPRLWTCSLADWRNGAEPAAQLRREIARGARLVAGLDPGCVLLRLLESPIEDAAKAREIWPALLDARIPFPLERCVAAFLPQTRLPEGGHACTAVAMRQSDLDAAVSEWQALGLDPDLLFPEALLLGHDAGTSVWNGKSRAVFFHVGPQGADAAGAARDPAPRLPALQRFLRAQTRPGPLRLSGQNLEALSAGIAEAFPELERILLPDSDLSVLLARAARGPDAAHANLRAGAAASPRLAKRRAASWRATAALLGLGLLLPTIGPFAVREGYARDRARWQNAAARVYAHVTGQASPFGQEALMLDRYLNDHWQPLREQALRIAAPGATDHLADLLDACRLSGLSPRKLILAGGRFDLLAPAPPGVPTAFAQRLRDRGWTVDDPAETDGLWRFQGRGAP